MGNEELAGKQETSMDQLVLAGSFATKCCEAFICFIISVVAFL